MIVIMNLSDIIQISLLIVSVISLVYLARK